MKKTFGTSVLILILCSSVLLVAYNNCSPGFSMASDVASSVTSAGSVTSAQANVVPVSVGCGYINEPCVSVTICVPGTTQCQTIPNVLLDTGSYGLRLFHQVSFDNFSTVSNLMTLPMTADPSNAANVVSECVSYADGSSDWGPLATADVTLGSETASNVPMQIINSSFGTAPSGCTDLDTTPIGTSGTGFNGILGVGLFVQDCGAACAPGASGAASTGVYFSCPSSGSGACTGLAVPVALQVTNPVSLMPVDNNGVILELPSVASNFGLADGVSSLDGYLVLGIGTQSNNTPGGTTVFPADGYGNFVTVFNGVTSSSSFIDSGSNALYFPQPAGLPTCSDDTSFYCPTSETTLSAVQRGANGSGSATVSFLIGNADDEFSQSNPNYIFADLAGPMSSDFDWGLPFFFGRNIYVGIEGGSSTLGAGPLWAY